MTLFASRSIIRSGGQYGAEQSQDRVALVDVRRDLIATTEEEAPSFPEASSRDRRFRKSADRRERCATQRKASAAK